MLRDGDSVVLDIFIPIRRYWCDMTRTVFFRSVSDEGRRVYETVKAANLAAEAVIRPGVPMKDIDRAARKLIEDAGYGPFFTHRLGHGCGLDCHEPPDNSASSPAVAEPATGEHPSPHHAQNEGGTRVVAEGQQALGLRLGAHAVLVEADGRLGSHRGE